MRSKCIVFVYLPGQTKAVPAGLLSITSNGRETQSSFVYGSGYIKRPDAISLDLIDLPLPKQEGVVMLPKQGRSLFGVFRDSAPDAWGRLVINDKYIRHHKYPDGQAPTANVIELPEMEYLLRSRPDRVGNLDFREKPTDDEPTKTISHVLHLKELIRDANRIAEHKPARADVMTLLRPATGMGGARPKTSIEDEGALWLAKFPMNDDRLPITRIEHAMLNLAEMCEIQTIEHKLLNIEGVAEPVFMIKRFDRILREDGSQERTGYISALTALGREEFEQSNGSYQDISTHLMRYADPKTQLEERKEVFRRMVLNVMVNNDDDHLRNHGVLRLDNGRSQLSPVFDIVPRMLMAGVGSIRRMAIGLGKDGRNATLENILSDLEPFGLTEEEAECEVQFVATTIAANWRKCLEDAGCKSEVVASLTETMSHACRVLEELAERDPMAYQEDQRLACCERG